MRFYCLLLTCAVLYGQEFEVATIKPVAPDPFPGITEAFDRSPDEGRFGEGGGSRANSGSFEVRGATMRMLIAHAYGVPLSRVIGPYWIDSQRYDIAAKIPGKPGLEGFQKMQQRLLAERFGLALRHEPRKTTLYRMTVAKNGHKLQPAIPIPVYANEAEMRAALQAEMAKAGPMVFTAGNQFGLKDASVDEIARRFEANTDLPIKNATGLSDHFSFVVRWSGGKDGFRDAVEDQLGLILTRSNEDLEVLVIEKADKAPTEN
jgi:uncharacterized protein (TIGR03435 family)